MERFAARLPTPVFWVHFEYEVKVDAPTLKMVVSEVSNIPKTHSPAVLQSDHVFETTSSANASS